MVHEDDIVDAGVRALRNRRADSVKGRRRPLSAQEERRRDVEAVLWAVTPYVAAQALDETALALYKGARDSQGYERLTTMEHEAHKAGLPAWLSMRAAAIREGRKK